MDRLEKMREERESKTVLYADYLKLRSRKEGFILVFEGKDCPTFYTHWFRSVNFTNIAGQIIARGKKKLLELRDLIKRNTQENSKTLFFTDKDYDEPIQPTAHDDIYTTNGYSIENELIKWELVRFYIESNFDIANDEDNISTDEAEEVFNRSIDSYKNASKEVHQVVYICKKNSIKCMPGNNIFDYIKFKNESNTFEKSYENLDELFTMLKIDSEHRENIKQLLAADQSFKDLDPIKDWRGKFHFCFLKKFLSYLRDLRINGAHPFKRPVKINIDPAQPTLMGSLAAFSRPSQCFENFITRHNS